jgi:ferritin-like protein
VSSEQLHEPADLLSEETKNMHRAIVSLIEELEAVDWYTQRAEACSDAELKATIIHHRDEEIEHAMMNLEWIRRHQGVFDKHMHTYLFTTGAITTIEAVAEGKIPPGAGAAAAAPSSGGGLGVGSLRPGRG